MSRNEEYLDLAGELADFARHVLRKRFRAPIPVETKPDGTPVTPVDREVEMFLRERIRRAFPDHGILGEEEGADRIDAEHVWVLDPIDGTRSFIAGEPLFGCLIALLRDGHPFLGIIESPVTEERWIGLDGAESLRGGERVGVRRGVPLSEAALSTGRSEHFPEELRPGLEDLRQAVRRTEPHCDCYAYGLLAQGDLDVVIEYGLSPYDYCALAPVVQGAGGVIHHWNGEALTLDGDGTVIAAASAELATEALARLQGRSG